MHSRWQALLRNSERRLQAGERRLTQLRRQWSAMRDECERLRSEIALQEQLIRASDLDGAVIDRRQLFCWLRKSAADKRRTQELRLTLRRQQERGEACTVQISDQHDVCKRLDGQRERYQALVRAERRKRLLRQCNVEESEAEERRSWSK